MTKHKIGEPLANRLPDLFNANLTDKQRIALLEIAIKAYKETLDRHAITIERHERMLTQEEA